MGILSWIVFGALAGWVASILVGRSRRMGCVANIIAGVAGALLGGFLTSLVGGAGVTGWNLQSFLVAVVGAVVFLAVTGWRGRRRRR
ncbi:MAG: GlsB/YeaQ/YmgE family stress response membrane protein [Anaerolineales bacterium]